MKYVIEATKTNAGTRKLPMMEDVFRCFQAIIEDRDKPRCEKMVDGHTGFFFTDKDGMPLVAMHWEHRFNHMVKRYNDIFRVQMPNITPHVCRHTYCSNMAKSGMNPKTPEKNWRRSRERIRFRRKCSGQFEKWAANCGSFFMSK